MGSRRVSVAGVGKEHLVVSPPSSEPSPNGPAVLNPASSQQDSSDEHIVKGPLKDPDECLPVVREWMRCFD